MRGPWAMAAVGAEGAFLALWLVAELLSHQSPRAATVSDLALSVPGWITAAFVAHAASLAAVAMHVPPARARAAAAVAALGMGVVAASPAGGSAWTQTTHAIGAWMAFGGVALAAGILARVADGALVRWTGVAVVAGTGLMLASQPMGLFPVFERVQLLVNGVWIMAIAWLPRAFKSGSQATETLHGR